MDAHNTCIEYTLLRCNNTAAATKQPDGNNKMRDFAERLLKTKLHQTDAERYQRRIERRKSNRSHFCFYHDKHGQGAYKMKYEPLAYVTEKNITTAPPR